MPRVLETTRPGCGSCRIRLGCLRFEFGARELPRPACGERVGVRGTLRRLGTRGEPPSPGDFGCRFVPDLSPHPAFARRRASAGKSGARWQPYRFLPPSPRLRGRGRGWGVAASAVQSSLRRGGLDELRGGDTGEQRDRDSHRLNNCRKHVVHRLAVLLWLRACCGRRFAWRGRRKRRGSGCVPDWRPFVRTLAQPLLQQFAERLAEFAGKDIGQSAAVRTAAVRIRPTRRDRTGPLPISLSLA